MDFLRTKTTVDATQPMGPLESAVMDVVWSHGECNVHDVAKRLVRPLAYTTVMTTLDRLYKKGLLQRRKEERAFFYLAAWTRVEWEQKRAGDLMAAFLAGPRPAGELLISCLVEAVGDEDAALLDQLERKVHEKRKELSRKERV